MIIILFELCIGSHSDYVLITHQTFSESYTFISYRKYIPKI